MRPEAELTRASHRTYETYSSYGRGLIRAFLLALFGGVLLAGCATSSPAPAAVAEPRPALTLTERAAILDQVAERLPAELRAKWDALRQQRQATIAETADELAFYRILGEMIGKLGVSHHGIRPPEAALTATPRGRDGYAGLAIQLVAGEAVVVRVRADSPAARAGLRPGDVIEAVGGVPMERLIARLRGFGDDPVQQRVWLYETMEAQTTSAPGAEVPLAVRHGDGDTRNLVLELVEPPGQRIEVGHLPPLFAEVESQRLADGIGYIRLSIFMPQAMQPFREAIADLRDCRGIILDLRGNPGGIGMLASPVAGAFLAEATSLGTTKLPDGELTYAVFPAERPYLGPLVLLIDEGTGSTSEMLAGGLQDLKRATLVGRRTMGAVLPSLFVELPSGAKLQFAVGDFTTVGGRVLEGKGVVPDRPVELSRELLLSDPDPFLTVAREALLNPTNEAAVP